MKEKRFRLVPAQIIGLSFLVMITVGTLLLLLPCATVSGEGAPLETAVFTATSAACVTGLIIEDTAQYWSGFGQTVILLLIQTGGMGVVTMAVVIMMFSGKKIGIKQRWIMQESISAPQVGGIVRMTGMILTVTLAVELLGAGLLSIRFCGQYGVLGIWYALFHSVSAFCNAGFDLMGINGAPCASLTGYSGDTLVSIVITLLILIGGLGFSTWNDIRTNGIKLKKYSLQSKLILSASLVLVLGGFAFMYFYEFRQSQWAGLSMGERATVSLFQAVTPRTAGFNTVELNNMSGPGKIVVLLLMLVGGAPGSTAGGFKLTTLAVLVLCIKTVFSNKDSVNAFGRRVPDQTIKNAAALFMLYILLFLGSGLFLCCVDKVPLMSALFETASAVATVGLSLGITAKLSTVSHILLIALMYFGRVGGLTLIYAVAASDGPDGARLPQERVAVG